MLQPCASNALLISGNEQFPNSFTQQSHNNAVLIQGHVLALASLQCCVSVKSVNRADVDSHDVTQAVDVAMPHSVATCCKSCTSLVSSKRRKVKKHGWRHTKCVFNAERVCASTQHSAAQRHAIHHDTSHHITSHQNTLHCTTLHHTAEQHHTTQNNITHQRRIL